MPKALQENLQIKKQNPKDKIYCQESYAQDVYDRFYGIDIERQANTGIVYHSLGVGAAAFRSVLQLEKLADHSKVLLPDMVFLDFGTNDILYSNTIDKQLPATVEKAIAQFRTINPNILIVTGDDFP